MAERNGVRLVGYLTRHLIKRLGFKKEHRVLVSNCSEQQALGIVGIGWHHNFQPGKGCHNLVHGLAVLGGRTKAGACGETNDQRTGRLAAKHVAELADLVNDLVHAHADEISKHDLSHRAHTHKGRT